MEGGGEGKEVEGGGEGREVEETGNNNDEVGDTLVSKRLIFSRLGEAASFLLSLVHDASTSSED